MHRQSRKTLYLPSLLWLSLLSACRCGEPPCNPCVLQDYNNYRYSAELDAPVHELLSAADVRFDWSDVSTNMRGQELDPADIDEVWLVVFQHWDPEPLAAGLASDTILQQDVTLFLTYDNSDSSCNLSDFNLHGNYLDPQQYFYADRGTWMVVLNSSALGSVQTLTMMVAADESTQTEVIIDDDSAVLSTDVDLSSLTPLVMPDHPDVLVDWSELRTDGLGNGMSVHTIDILRVARYDEALDEIEQRFFELEDLAEESWTMEVGGTLEADLAGLQGDHSFEGVVGEGSWLMGLECSSCDNPAPRFLTVLIPD